MEKLYNWLASAYFVVATFTLMALAIVLLGSALWNAVVSIRTGDASDAALDAIATLIIGFAVIETAKFIAEEEVLRTRELRSTAESRRSITKFITIIVIALSLEALVMVFRSSHDNVALTIYPAALFVAAMLALVALGLYQWLSSRIGDDDEEAHDVAAQEDRHDAIDGNEPPLAG